jgi:hypothetical protein
MSDFSFYFEIGWKHIITTEALDHIFFIAALAAIYMLKDWRQVLILVTAFTLGHTITLALSSLSLIEVSSDWVEFLVPCTIVFTAISNLFQKTFTAKAIRINYFLALFFGLIHGLAFANTLRMLIAGDQSFALSMFSFSVGLELGQVLIVFIILLLTQLVVNLFKIARRDWVIFLSSAVMALALQMAIERWPVKQMRKVATINIESKEIKEVVLREKEEDVVSFCQRIIFRCVTHLYR